MKGSIKYNHYMAREKNFDQQEVLTKAMELFWCRGYFDTSMQDLTEGLGISRSSLYDTYGGKKELYVRALRHYLEGMNEAFFQLLQQPGSARVALQNLLEVSSYNLLTSEVKKGCFWANSIVEVMPHDPEIATIIQENNSALQEALIKVIKRGQKAGEISTRFPARSVATLIYNTMLGLRVMAKTNAGKETFKNVIETMLATLM